jgi:NADPH-dependent ferric siderophore reductase
MTSTTYRLPMIIDQVEVTMVERLSPTFVRVEFEGPALAEFGVDGPWYDQRIKLVFPNAAGDLPSLGGADETWLTTWMDLPADERGHMRSYSVRAVRGSDADTRLVVDFVLHLAEGHTGPGSAWAATAAVGDRLILLGPRRGFPARGIEFEPGTASTLLLVADETAVPAVSGILEDLPASARGAVFLEVPHTDDVLDVWAPAGVSVVWLPRDGADHGVRLVAAVRDHLGVTDEVEIARDEIDPDLWETPTYSSSGEDVTSTQVSVGHDLDGMYAWIAGEAAVVTALRRYLVRELGMDRGQVAFMGYWRQEVSRAGR